MRSRTSQFPGIPSPRAFGDWGALASGRLVEPSRLGGTRMTGGTKVFWGARVTLGAETPKDTWHWRV